MKSMKLLKILVFLMVLIIANAATATDSVIINSTALFTEPSISEPAYLGSYIDENFKTKVTRIAQYTMTWGGVQWGNRVRHHYSKTQPWNADMSLLLINNTDDGGGTASPSKLILNGDTYEYLFGLDFTTGEYRWHPTNPDFLFYLANSNSLKRYNIATNTHTTLRTFSEYSTIALLSEGNLSNDGKWVAFYASNGDVFAYESVRVIIER